VIWGKDEPMDQHMGVSWAALLRGVLGLAGTFSFGGDRGVIVADGHVPTILQKCRGRS
jgi:hypothetical protein